MLPKEEIIAQTNEVKQPIKIEVAKKTPAKAIAKAPVVQPKTVVVEKKPAVVQAPAVKAPVAAKAVDTTTKAS